MHGAFWFLFKVRRTSIRVYVAAVHVSALSVRSVDAARLAIPGAAGDCKRDGHRRLGSCWCRQSGWPRPLLLLAANVVTLRRWRRLCVSVAGAATSRLAPVRGRAAEGRAKLRYDHTHPVLLLRGSGGGVRDPGGDAAQCGTKRDFSGDLTAGHGGNFLDLHAEFLFIVQIILYAGGIMVLFVFVIMLVNLDVTLHQIQFTRQWLVASCWRSCLARRLRLQIFMSRRAFIRWRRRRGGARAQHRAGGVVAVPHLHAAV